MAWRANPTLGGRPLGGWVRMDALEPRVMLSADLQVAVGALTGLPATLIPGDRLRVPVTLSNAGDEALNGTATVKLFASTDGTLGSGDVLLGTLARQSVKLAPTQSRNAVVQAVVPNDPDVLAPGNYFLLASVEGIAGDPSSGDTDASDATVPVAYRIGTFDQRRNAAITLTDADGTQVKFALSGAGSGLVTPVSSGASFNVALSGTDAKTKLTVTTKKSAANGDDGLARLGDVTVTGALGTITAKTADLLGDVTVTGSLGGATLRSVPTSGAGHHTIQIGASSDPRLVAVLNLGDVSDTSIDSNMPVTVNVARWRDGGGQNDLIEAPALGALNAKGSKIGPVVGDFEADLAITGSSSAKPFKAAITGAARGTWVVEGAAAGLTVGAFSSTFAGSFSGRINALTAGGDVAGTLAAASFGNVNIKGNLTNAVILAGADLGNDAKLGGSAGNADTFAAGAINAFNVTGTITDSIVTAGYSPQGGGAFLDGNDAFVGGATAGNSFIKAIKVGGAVSDRTTFAAVGYPRSATLNKVKVDPATDARFVRVPGNVRDFVAPTVTIGLTRDTAANNGTNTDLLTSDAGVRGTISDSSAITLLEVSIDNGAFVAAPADALTATGSGATYALTAAQLRTLNGNQDLADGLRRIRVRATDALGNVSAIATLSFTLDTQPPPAVTAALSALSDTGTPGDNRTSSATVTLTGTAAPGATLTLLKGSTSIGTVLANVNGAFQLPNVALDLGDNVFTARIDDVAGNASQSSVTITRVAPEQGDTANVVLTWNDALLEAVRMTASSPTVASRVMAIQSLSVYDALQAIQGLPGFYVTPAGDHGGASADAAAAAASHRVLVSLFPSQKSALDAALATSLDAIADGTAQTLGVALGQQVADSILAIRAGDGSDDFVDYSGSNDAGFWRPTPPVFDVALTPQWATLEPFAMTSPDQFLPAAPPALSSEAYAISLNEVKALGNIDSGTRTADQTEIARFWAGGTGTYTPAGHWNQIARKIAFEQRLSAADSARLLAKLNVALADAGIVAWNAKYEYDLWRPVTAIPNADVDGNAATTADPDWQPLLVTPPFPEYLSGHSTYSAAAAEVLTDFFGEDVAFSITSTSLPGVTRSYDSFEEAAQEAGRSRIFGGIHYEFTNQASLAAGRDLGQYVVDRFDVSADVQSPRITLSGTPVDGVVATTNVTLTGQVTDNLSGVASLTARVDNGQSFAVAFDDSGQFSLTTSLALNGSGDGVHTITLSALDNAGNASTVRTFRFTLDTRAPIVTLSLPSGGATLAAGDLLSGTADPTGSSIVSLSYVFDAGTPNATEPIAIVFNPQNGAFSQPLDLSRLAVGAHTLTVTAVDAAGRSAASVRNVTLPQAAPLRIAEVTPVEGAQDVGVTFRPRVTFTRPVQSGSVDSSNFYATDATGQVIPGTVVLSDDGTYAIILFTEAMPGGTEVTLHVVGDTILPAGGGAALDADGDGDAGGTLESNFTTVSLEALPGTTLSGIVADPGADKKPNTIDDVRAGADQSLMTPDDVYLNPLANVRVYILGFEGQPGYDTFTDANGFFEFESVPTGSVKVAVDGRTATNAPSGVFFPEMVLDLQIVAGQANTIMDAMALSMGRVVDNNALGMYLPRLATSILKPISDTEPTTIVADEAAAPELTPQQRELLTITVQPGSAIGFDGQVIADPQVGIATVPPELVREMLPPGLLQHTFDITIQAPGVALFSTPAAITFPNVFNAAPGTKLNLLSFDHTTGRLVLDGTATVSADGTVVASDPGSGVTHPGWHGQPPPGDDNDDDDPDDDDDDDDDDNDDDGDPDDEDDDDDNDGDPDDGDDDDDDDGIPDDEEDEDGDGTPDDEEDSDDDGTPDDDDDDDDNDGIPDEDDTDDDGDGIPDDEEDADGDGIPDVQEDADGDGIPDPIDPDDDNDGTADDGDNDDNCDGVTDSAQGPDTFDVEPTVVLPLITGEVGVLPALAWAAPAEVPPATPTEDCPDPITIQPYLRVTIDVDGPLEQYMQATGDLSLVTQTFTLSAGSGEARVFGGSARFYDQMFGPGGIVNLNRDQLYGSKITITEEAGQPDGSVQTLEKTYLLYRWVDVVDPVPAAARTGNTARFARTLADGPGGFVRTKNVDVSVPTTIDTQFLSGDVLATAFGYGPAVFGDTTANWTFDPFLSGERTDTIRIVADGLEVGSLAAVGTATNKTRISVDLEGYKNELRRVINALQNVSTPGPDMVFGTADDVSFVMYDYGGGVLANQVTFGADGAPGLQGVDDNGNGTPDDFAELGRGDDRVKIASNRFLTEFATVLPGQNPSSATLNALLDSQANALMAAVAADYGAVATGYEVVPANAGANVTMQWLDLGQGLYGEADFDINDPYLKTHLPGNSLGQAAKQIALSEGLNVEPTNDGKFAIAINLSWRSAASFAQFMANTVSHELAHTFGLNDSYANSPSGTVNVNPPGDIMRAGNDFDADLSFSTYNSNILAAAIGIQANGDTPLTADLTLYRSAYNLPTSATGIREESFDLTPALGVVSNGTNIMPGLTVTDLGPVVADGAGGNQVTRQFTLTNLGYSALTLGSVALTAGADKGFSIVGAPNAGAVLAAGASTTVSVRFDPTTAGAFEGNLRITSNSSGVPQFNIPLKADAFAQAPTAFVEMLGNNNLGGVRPGQGSSQEQQLFKITNTGAQPLSLSSFTLAQGADQFQFLGLPGNIGTTPISLARGQSFVFGLSFTPTATGLQLADIRIATNDPAQSTLRLGAVGTGLPGVVKANWGNDYVAVQIGDAAPLQTRTNNKGAFEVFLPSLSRYEATIFDPQTGLVGFTSGRTGPSGQKTSLTRTMRFGASSAPDTDYDGLPDDIEKAIGSAPNRTDSDRDGLSDFAEIQQGLDPLGGLGIPVGVVAGVSLQGQSRDIAIASPANNPDVQLAYLATGAFGLAIVDVSNFRAPLVRAQLDLSGDNTSVSVDDVQGIAAVAAGTVLHVVDVSNPASPALIRSIDVPATRVEVVDGLAYVAAGADLRVYDLGSGELIQSLTLGGTISQLARERDTLYALASSGQLRVIEISGPTAVLRGALTVAGAGNGLFAGNGLVYVGASNGGFEGLNLVNATNPNAPTLVSGVDNQNIASRGIALNGSGLGVTVGNPSFNGPTLQVLNTTDPANTGNLVTAVNLPAEPRGVAIANGIALVATDAGLSIVNYRSFDNLGIPPTVSISSSAADNSPGVPGVQVQEGSFIPIAAQISDDVQVRSVEVLVNGQVVRTDVSFPFDLDVAAPLLASASTALVQVRVTDTGGNVATSNTLTFGLTPDITPPQVVGVFPADDSQASQSLRIVRVDFNEPIDPNTINASTLRLVGPDGQSVTPLNLAFRRNGRSVTATYASLEQGAYQIVVNAQAVRDLAGNAIGGDNVASNFFIGQASIGWIGGNGFWDDPNNWDAGRVPTADDDVLIEVPDDVTITIRSGTVAVNKITSSNRINITGGVVTAADSIQVNNTFTLSGGTLRNTRILPGAGGLGLTLSTTGGTLDNVISDADINADTQSAFVTITNGLTLNATLTLGATSTRVVMSGTQTIGGTGQIVFGDFANTTVQVTGTGSTLTLGPDLTVRGGSGQSNGGQIGVSAVFGGGNNVSIVNQGTISADVSGRTIRMRPSGTGVFINTGTLEAVNGTLTLDNTWDNNGTLNLEGGVLNLDGAFSTADIGTFTRTGGTVNLLGTLNNTGTTLTLDATKGLWNFLGASISGGTLAFSGGGGLVPTTSGGTLSGVTLSSDLTFGTDSTFVTITNGLTLNSTLTLGATSTRLIASGTQTIGGTGQIVFGDFANTTVQASVSNMTLTLGPDLTIRGGSGQSNGGQVGVSAVFGGGNNVSIVNQGTISSDVAGRTIRMRPNGTGVFTNTGTLEAVNGTLTLDNLWDNNGTLNLDGGVLNLDGTFGTADLGTFTRTGGTVNLLGVLNNTGTTLSLDATKGLWNFLGASISGGTLAFSGGGGLVPTTSGGTLSGVTLASDLTFDTANTFVTITNGLTLNSTLTLGATSTRLIASGTQTIGGTGQIVFGDFANTTVQTSVSNMTLTLGPDLTIRGGSGQSNGGQVGVSAVFGGGNNVSIVNQGTISSDVAGRTIAIRASGTGAVTNEGTISASAGALVAVTGPFTNTAAGAVSIAIGSTAAGQIGRLTISGAATLAGTLNLSRVNGFTAALGNTFQIVTFASLTGTFTTVTGTSAGTNVLFDPQYTATNLTLNTIAG